MSYYQTLYHIVFRTYKSERTVDEQNEKALYAYIFAFCRNHGIRLYRINGMPDHIHMCVSVPPDMAISDFVRELKKSTNNYMAAHRKEFPMFNGWARSFACLSYGVSERESVVNYIKNQKEHHKKVSFKDEIFSILSACRIPLDAKFFKTDWEE